MALIYQAQLAPSKIEVLRAWVPSQPWSGAADLAGLRAVGAYRFDDPAGQVGIETHLLTTDAGAILQVPLTYRPEPLTDLPAVAIMQHSVLGRRWVYDGCADPVYAQALLTAILTGAPQADLMIVTDDGEQRREPTTFAQGSGTPGTPVPTAHFGSVEIRGTTTVLSDRAVELTVLHVLDPAGVSGAVPGEVPGLTGRWPGQDEPAVLALIRGVGADRAPASRLALSEEVR